MSSRTIHSLSAVRALVIDKQGLNRKPMTKNRNASMDEIYSIVDSIGCVQIDSLQMVRRSQYIVLWSRLGLYDTDDFDKLIYSESCRRLFEYWLHEASIIPLTWFPALIPVMQCNRNGRSRGSKNWLEEFGNRQLMDDIFDRVSRNGCAKSSDFREKRLTRGSWWDWKPEKRALEILYDRGSFMVTSRINFQKVYDLKERVLPKWVNKIGMTRYESYRYLLINAMKALGICHPSQIGDYIHVKRTVARPFVRQLLDEGVIVKVKARLQDDTIHDLVVHKDDLELLNRASDNDIDVSDTTFLSPFDNLFWARDRDLQFWGFQQVLEAYKPKHLRKWGYFCLPILHKNRLVGRIDPKIERQKGILILHNIILEPGISVDDEILKGVASALKRFRDFNDCEEILIEKSTPKDFALKLKGEINSR